jgi:hypothetical protein
LNGDGTEDVGLMEQDGVQADAYIDRFLAANGVTVPITRPPRPPCSCNPSPTSART